MTPAPPGSHSGNRATAERWARRLVELGYDSRVTQAWSGEPADVLVALHATRSFASVERFHRQRPDAPIVVALTGTDLYVDLPKSAETLRSIQLATRLVTLQPLAVESVPTPYRAKVHVIYQSAEASARQPLEERTRFQVCVLAHLRPVKDPLRAAIAVRALPSESRVTVAHAGAPLDPALAEHARSEQRVNPRYRWFGDLAPADARRLLTESQILAVTSLSEGGANVVTEAIASGVPVVSSRIAGSVGLLGHDYPGYYPARDTAALCALLRRVEGDRRFCEELGARCEALRPLTRADRERESWRVLLSGVGCDRGAGESPMELHGQPCNT